MTGWVWRQITANIGLVYYNTGDYPKALEYHTKAREIDESLNDRVGMARDYTNIGLVYYTWATTQRL